MATFIGGPADGRETAASCHEMTVHSRGAVPVRHIAEDDCPFPMCTTGTHHYRRNADGDYEYQQGEFVRRRLVPLAFFD